MPANNKSRNITRWVKRNQGKHLCHCGCGEPIVIKREHYKKSVGIPKFLKGHNLKFKKDEPLPELPKKETAWDRLTPEEKEQRLSHLSNFKKGKENPSWKGGRRKDENGYIQILCPEHPFANDGYVAEHRLVVESRTRKYDPQNKLLVEVDGELYLKPSSVVHHIDEVKDNNYGGSGPGDDGNLMLLENQKAHAFIHNSPLPMEERLRRIEMGVYHSRPIQEDD